MSHLDAMPLWLAVPVAALCLLGSLLTLLGAVGLVRLASFYDRLHAPTLGTSGGTFAIALASMALFSQIEGRAVLHESLVVVFVLVTTPVTMMVLGRTALYRDRTEGSDAVPPPLGEPVGEPTGTAGAGAGPEGAPGAP